jgi:hypothetical protein
LKISQELGYQAKPGAPGRAEPAALAARLLPASQTRRAAVSR